MIESTTTIAVFNTTVITSTSIQGITQPYGIARLDLLSRYKRQYNLLHRFSITTLLLDQLISPIWIPFALIGCSFCAVTHGIIYCKTKSRNPRPRENVEISVTIYFLALSTTYLVRVLAVVLIELDSTWDTGVLAWNQIACPLTHAMGTASSYAASVITITLGIEILTRISQTQLWLHSVRLFIANGNPQRAKYILTGLLTTCCLLGLIETLYWRVEYYLPQAADLTSGSTQPLARCEVIGHFEYFLTTSLNNPQMIGTYETVGKPNKAVQTAASFIDYKWITGILLGISLALSNITVALIIIRLKMLPHFEDSRRHYSLHKRHMKQRIAPLGVKYIAMILLTQGVLCLPKAMLQMLQPLTRPGEVYLTDSEIEIDGTWQRYFMLLSTSVVAEEVADIPTALMFPICLIYHQRFRKAFCSLFRFWKRDMQTENGTTNPSHLRTVNHNDFRNRIQNSKRDVENKLSHSNIHHIRKPGLLNMETNPKTYILDQPCWHSQSNLHISVAREQPHQNGSHIQPCRNTNLNINSHSKNYSRQCLSEQSADRFESINDRFVYNPYHVTQLGVDDFEPTSYI